MPAHSASPRPRTRPPSFKSSPAAPVIESQSFTERLLPPLFFGFLVLVFLGSAALLLWTPEPSADYDLTNEELRVLNEEASPEARDAAARPPASRATSAAAATEAASAVLDVETTPPGAVVAIDGTVAGVTPLREHRLTPRWHIVSVEHPGFAAEDTLVYLEEGVPTVVSMALGVSESEGPDAAAALDAAETDVEVPDAAGTDAEAPEAALAPSEASSGEQPAAAPPSAPTTGTISVAVNPAGVPVQLDGRTVGVAPMQLNDVPPGAHTLTFFLPGYETATVEVAVEPGMNEVVDIALVPQTGTLTVVARPWGSVYVDGKLRARDTDVSVEVTLPVGPHEVRVEHPTLGTQERTVEVRPDRTTSAVFDLN